jgi:hypothetical protein
MKTLHYLPRDVLFTDTRKCTNSILHEDLTLSESLAFVTLHTLRE